MTLTFRSEPEVGILLSKIMNEYLPLYFIYINTFVGFEKGEVLWLETWLENNSKLATLNSKGYGAKSILGPILPPPPHHTHILLKSIVELENNGVLK